MSILQKILADEKKPPTSEKNLSVKPPSSLPSAPCPACGCRDYWRSPYGYWHCQACEVPPFVMIRGVFSVPASVVENSGSDVENPAVKSYPWGEPATTAAMRIFGDPADWTMKRTRTGVSFVRLGQSEISKEFQRLGFFSTNGCRAG